VRSWQKKNLQYLTVCAFVSIYQESSHRTDVYSTRQYSRGLLESLLLICSYLKMSCQEPGWDQDDERMFLYHEWKRMGRKNGHNLFFFRMPRLISRVRDKHEHPGWGRPVSRVIFAFDYQWHVLNYRPRKWGEVCLWDFIMCSVNQHYYIGKAQNGVLWRHEGDYSEQQEM
jgi:hypothetical protein